MPVDADGNDEPRQHEGEPVRVPVVEIAGSLEPSGTFATVDWDGVAALWSIPERRSLTTFKVAHDFGGRRLALIEDRLVVGQYHRSGKVVSGVRAYDLSGALIWERTDLKQPQDLNPLPNGHVAVGLGYSSLQVLTRDGETVQRIRAARSMYGSSATDAVLVQGSPQWVALYDSAATVAQRWKRRVAQFAVLDAAISETEVAISEAGGDVSAFDLEGETTWSWSPPEGRHVLALEWAPRQENWVAVLFAYERVEPSTLMTFSRDGEVLGENRIVRDDRSCFVDGGDFLVVTVNGALHVLRAPAAEQLWELD